MKENQKGITLVALVITVIIIIILAIVAISFALGNNGLINRAEDASDLYANDIAYTEGSIANVEVYINDVLGEMNKDDEKEPVVIPETVEEAREGYIFKETTDITDASGDVVWIPGGFKVASDTGLDADDGVVITDGTNEFVWVPVSEASMSNMFQEGPINLTGVNVVTNIYSKPRLNGIDSFEIGKPGTTALREPDLLNEYDTDPTYYRDILEYDTVEEMADAWVQSYASTYNTIEIYGGFYIGRYELTGQQSSPTVERNADVLTDLNWYQLKKACVDVANTDYVGTDMIYGNLWDEVMAWIVATGDKTSDEVYVNSSTWGNYKDSIDGAQESSGIGQKSATNAEWVANNIYDLAGNYYEWTQETVANTRIYRGGDHTYSGSERPAAKRGNSYSYNVVGDTTSRVILYIKK